MPALLLTSWLGESSEQRIKGPVSNEAEGKNQHLRLTSDLYPGALAYAYPYSHTYKHTHTHAHNRIDTLPGDG